MGAAELLVASGTPTSPSCGDPGLSCCPSFPCRSLADEGSGAEPPVLCTLERLAVTFQLHFVWDKD